MIEAHSLQQHLQGIIPSARLEQTCLPDCPAIKLWLLNSDYPQGNLDPEQVQQVMDNPLYWVFCWASGQVLADFLLSNPHWVAQKRVLDFGCGSGVVAVAAALAGAAEVIACDIDPMARTATKLNASLNDVTLTVASDYDAIEGPVDLIIVADVLYDRANLSWLQRFRQRAQRVLIADSRVKDFDFPPYRQIERCDSFTVPDLDESAEFRDVRIYLAD
ncbi:Ribosomal protein L11 methyltransferase [Halioglobus japonicus]|nr:Ribosomal protein L11 methyltransferase [Halioglobus japonicus]